MIQDGLFDSAIESPRLLEFFLETLNGRKQTGCMVDTPNCDRSPIDSAVVSREAAGSLYGDLGNRDRSGLSKFRLLSTPSLDFSPKNLNDSKQMGSVVDIPFLICTFPACGAEW